MICEILVKNSVAGLTALGCCALVQIHKRFPDRSFEQVFQRLFGPSDPPKSRQIAPKRRQEEAVGSSVLGTRMRPYLDRPVADNGKVERRASTS